MKQEPVLVIIWYQPHTIIDRAPNPRFALQEPSYQRVRNDRASYHFLEQSLADLQPKVVVVCHCDKDSIEYGLLPSLYSLMDPTCETELLTLRHGHQCFEVNNYHPT